MGNDTEKKIFTTDEKLADIQQQIVDANNVHQQLLGAYQLLLQIKEEEQLKTIKNE